MKSGFLDERDLLGAIRTTQGYYEESIGFFMGAERLFGDNSNRLAKAKIEKFGSLIWVGRPGEVDLSQIPSDLSLRTRTDLLNLKVMMLMEKGNFREALETAAEQESLLTLDNYQYGLASVLGTIGLIHALLGETQNAADYTIRSQLLANQLGLNEIFLVTQANWVAIRQCQGGVQTTLIAQLSEQSGTFPSINWSLKYALQACMD